MPKTLRIYVDTSVIGGCIDEEFAQASLKLIEAARRGQFALLVSETLVEELAEAPQKVRNILVSLPEESVERLALTGEMLELQEAYLAAGILTPRWADDALHVAAATVARADAIVSWNFRHIVQLSKIHAYNNVNLMNGYGIVTILSPKEVVDDEQENSDEDL